MHSQGADVGWNKSGEGSRTADQWRGGGIGGWEVLNKMVIGYEPNKR